MIKLRFCLLCLFADFGLIPLSNLPKLCESVLIYDDFETIIHIKNYTAKNLSLKSGFLSLTHDSLMEDV